MPTKKEIDLCKEILELSVSVSTKGKYHAFCDFFGHVGWLSVRAGKVFDGDSLLGDSDEYVFNKGVYLSGYSDCFTESIALDRLESIKSKLTNLLDE